MVEYKIVKQCGLCRKRMVLQKSEAKKHYCDSCRNRIQQAQKEEE